MSRCKLNFNLFWSPNSTLTLPPMLCAEFPLQGNMLGFQFDILVRSLLLRSNSPLDILPMPATTERQQITEALHKALLFNLITELKQDAESSSNSSSDISDDSTTSSSESENKEGAYQMEDHLHSMAALYTDHYYNTYKSITKTGVNLQLLMNDYKINCPEIFKTYLQITPNCFISIIKDEDVFLNNSNNEQMLVAHQAAIALYRFGYYGNAVDTVKVTLWAGYGYGTVWLATKHVMAALCSKRFCQSAIRWPSEEAKDAAKALVEDHSRPRWQDGWLIVDSILVPLYYMHPAHYSNSNWFDWKSNYSLNVQVTIICHILLVWK